MKRKKENKLKKAISFTSEHTIEFLLTIKIKSILSRRFNNVIPIYFWSSREGNLLSSKIHSQYTIQLLAVFPRRPKIVINESGNIYGKINSTLFNYAKHAKNLNIPVILGFPIINSIIELNSSAEFIWLSIPPYQYKDLDFKVSRKKDFSIIGNDNINGINVLNENEICAMLFGNAEFSWKTAIENIKKLNQSLTITRLFLYSYYKPIYFIIFKNVNVH